jgi:hypothetical protein
MFVLYVPYFAFNNYLFRENGPPMKTARQLSKGNRTGSGQNPETMLEIVTLNIEGIKSNSPYLKHLGVILCLSARTSITTNLSSFSSFLILCESFVAR